MSLAGLTESLASNSPACRKANFSEFGDAMDHHHFEAIAKAMTTNSHCTELSLERCGMGSEDAALFVPAILANSTLKELDLGYNSIGGDTIVAICEAIAKNSNLEVVKIHRQAEDYGHANEEKIVKLWDNNVTLARLYATLHNRTANSTNTRNEVRNKEISKRKASGKVWADLDPSTREEYAKKAAAARKAKEEAEAKAMAPIAEKVASTGGPYTYKQLTAAKEFLPDDVDQKNMENHLADDEFSTVFKMNKEEFTKLPGWKKNSIKKEAKLH